MGTAADVNADVATLEGKLRVIPTATAFRQGLGSGGRHQVVLSGIHIQHRHDDVPQIHSPVADIHFALDQLVLLKEILGKLAERRAGLVRAIENPFFHPQKISQCLGIVEDIGQVHVLLPG